MTTAGYHPAFILLGTQFANTQTQQAVAANPSLPPVYVETSWWPLALASQNPSTEQLVNTMHTYAKGDTDRLRRRGGGRGVAPVGEGGLGLWRQPHGDLRAEQRGRREELGRRRHRGARLPSLTLSNENPQPSPCFAILKIEVQGDRLRQGDHPAHAVHLELQPQERRPADRGSSSNN